ncbi:MAG TPA: cupin domain-containing protein [Solirubrobacteraceae bacterium]|nr:cupin domain-containing protein [Solirubrobacteraceae bacterium]
MGITHFDEARGIDYALGHLTSRWTLLGEAAGSVRVGVRRIQVPAGSWTTPAHEHGREEEIFYVLAGRGVSWQRGKTADVRAGDCIVYLPRRGAHSLHAVEPIDVLAFGPRFADEVPRFPRLGYSLVGGRAVQTTPGVIERAPFQFVLESQLGPPELPEEPGPRPSTIVNVADVEETTVERARVHRTRKDLGRAAGSRETGIQLVDVAPGREGSPSHCHSAEEELFVILDGSGTLVLGYGEAATETPVGPGHVVSRPPGTGVAHVLRAGPDGLRFLAYGTREPGDICFYPRSSKLGLPGGIYVRVEPLDYWDGED